MGSFEDLLWINQERVKFKALGEIVVGKGVTSPFSAKWGTTIHELAVELRAYNARNIVMEVSYPPGSFRNDGLPKASARPTSPVVVLTFDQRVWREGDYRRLQHRYPSTKFSTFEDNVRALALGLRGLRRFSDYGLGSEGQQYAGFAQLESPAVSNGRRLIEQENGNVRQAMKRYSPDMGSEPDEEKYRDILAADQAS